MATVQRWTGAETKALRHAMCLSIRAFAEHLGVDARTVNKWEARGNTITLLPDTQALLDTALSRASEDVQIRFTQTMNSRQQPSPVFCRKVDEVLSTSSWLEWEAGVVPNRDYQDLLRRLLTTGPVQSGHPREESELPDPGHSLAEGLSQAGFHMALTSNQESVRRILDESLSTLTDEDLFLHIDKIERVILALCKHTLLASLGCDNRNGRPYVLENVLRIKNRTLILKIRPDLQFDQLLRIVFQDPKLPYFDSPGDYSHTEIWLNDSVGHYQGVRVTLPTHLSTNLCDQIAHQVADEFTDGYLWLNELIQRALTRLGGAFEHDSLQLLRRQFLIHGRADFAHQLWLVKVADERVTYVVDEGIATRVLQAGREFRGLQQAPSSIAFALLANSIPLERSFSCRAIGENRTIDMSLTNAPYGAINEDFLVAQSAIYADRMLLTPLTGDRRGWLLAAYPSVIRTDVASVLDDTRTDLENYFISKPTRMCSPVIRHPIQHLPPKNGAL